MRNKFTDYEDNEKRFRLIHREHKKKFVLSIDYIKHKHRNKVQEIYNKTSDTTIHTIKLRMGWTVKDYEQHEITSLCLGTLDRLLSKYIVRCFCSKCTTTYKFIKLQKVIK